MLHMLQLFVVLCCRVSRVSRVRRSSAASMKTCPATYQEGASVKARPEPQSSLQHHKNHEDIGIHQIFIREYIYIYNIIIFIIHNYIYILVCVLFFDLLQSILLESV